MGAGVERGVAAMMQLNLAIREPLTRTVALLAAHRVALIDARRAREDGDERECKRLHALGYDMIVDALEHVPEDAWHATWGALARWTGARE